MRVMGLVVLALLAGCAMPPVATSVRPAPSPAVTPSPEPVAALEGTPLAVRYLETVPMELSRGSLRVRDATTLHQLYQQQFGEPRGHRQAPAVDFSREELLVVYEMLHACVGWPDRKRDDYERVAELVERDGKRVFRHRVALKAGRFALLCDPMPSVAVFAVARAETPVVHVNDQAFEVLEPEAVASGV